MTLSSVSAHAPGDGKSIDVSIVIPAYNEEDNIDPMMSELLGVLDGMPQTAEVILVDDGSRDQTGPRALAWAERDARVRVVQFRRNFGQTAGMTAGFDHARGRVVITMDADQQNDPRDLALLLEKMAEGYDVVSGWRLHRKDKLLLRKFPSKMANKLISKITGTALHDYGCTLKAYDASVVDHLRLYGEQHRFIPALAVISGATIIEVPVNHRPRTRGTSKYGISRTVRVLLDLITVKFFITYLTRPMQLFGRVGIFTFLAAMASAVMVVVQRAAGFHILKGETFTSLAVILSIVAVQFVCMGLLGELLIRIYHDAGVRKSYVVRRSAGFGGSGADVIDLDLTTRRAQPANGHVAAGVPASGG